MSLEDKYNRKNKLWYIVSIFAGLNERTSRGRFSQRAFGQGSYVFYKLYIGGEGKLNKGKIRIAFFFKHFKIATSGG